MAVTQTDPGTIYLGGGVRTLVNDLATAEVLTPGMLVERFNNAGTVRWRKHSTAGGAAVRAVVQEAGMLNMGVSGSYAVNDLVEVGEGTPGSTWWMIIPSGQNIAAGQKLESNGDGKLRALASGVALYASLENKDNSVPVVDARIRVEQI